MKKLILFLMACLFLVTCSKEENSKSIEELEITTRSKKHVQILVTNANTTPATDELVNIYTSMPICECVPPECQRIPTPFTSFRTDKKHGKIRVKGDKNGFAPSTTYYACVQEVNPPCQLSHFITCDAPGAVCEYIGKCVAFSTTAKRGSALVTIQKD